MGLSSISETSKAEYKIRLFENHEFDDVEPNNTKSGHTHICNLLTSSYRSSLSVS